MMKNRIMLGGLWIVLLLVAAACEVTAPPEVVLEPGGTRITTVSQQIFRAENIQVQEIKQIEAVPELAGRETRFMSWAPDGSKFLFVARSGDIWDLWVAKADGSQPRLLRTNGYGGVWSPDGQKVVYYAHIEDKQEKRAVWVVNADGSDPRQVGELNRSLDWLDTDTVMFIYEDTICLVDDRGQNMHPLNLNEIDGRPRRFHLAPDKQRIALIAGEGGGLLWSARIERETLTEAKRLMDFAVAGVVWAPDSTRIFVEGPPMRIIDVKSNKVLTEFPHWNIMDNPTWSPDGQVLALNLLEDRQITDTVKLYLVNADGTGLRGVDIVSQNIRFPQWSPRGDRIGCMINWNQARIIYIIQ